MAERTKIWIAESMKKLMLNKTIEKIRVTEICALAEIERPTFYYHFKDKYELVAWIFFHDAFVEDVISVESASQSLNQMRKDFLFYKRAYEDKSQNPLWEYMLEYFVEKYEQLAQKMTDNDILDVQTKFSIRLYCYGSVAMTKEWLLNDNITPAETVVTMMYEAMPKGLREIFF